MEAVKAESFDPHSFEHKIIDNKFQNPS